MLRLTSVRTIAFPLALLASSAWPCLVFGQETCTVKETQRIATVTGQFSVGSSTVSLTLPNVLFRADPSVVYMQVSGNGLPSGLLLDSGREKAIIEDGAGLHLFSERNRRLTFSLIDKSGRHLCEWVTHVGTSNSGPPTIPQGFGQSDLSARTGGFKLRSFRNAGDPILLQVGGLLARESGEYSIDGAPITVLARNACQVVLWDPHPVAGLRTIESRGYSISIPFIVMRLEVGGSASRGRATLIIRVLGRDQVPLPELLQHRVFLYNYNPAGLKLSCGKALDYGDPTMVSLTSKDGAISASCEVRLLRSGPIHLDAAYMESGFGGVRGLPTQIPRWPPRPWPRIPLAGFIDLN